MAKGDVSLIDSRIPKMSGHKPKKGALPCGDYYGQAKRNPIGKLRDSTFEPTTALKSKKNAKPTPIS